MNTRLTVLATAAAAALALPALGIAGGEGGSRAATLPTANLLANADAEGAPGTKNYGVVSVPGWQGSAGFTAMEYIPRSTDVPNTEQSGALAGGRNFFTVAVTNESVTTATQSVDVSTEATTIDAGSVQATLSALIGGHRQDTDTGFVQASFRDASGAELGKVAVGPSTVAERKGTTMMSPKTKTAFVPVGTRSIAVSMVANRLMGSYTDVYFDNLSLKLADQPAPQTAMVVTRVCTKAARAVNALVRPTGGLRIASVAFAIKGAPAVTIKTAPFSARLPMTGKAKVYTVTAKVTDAIGRVSTLVKTVKACA